MKPVEADCWVNRALQCLRRGGIRFLRRLRWTWRGERRRGSALGSASCSTTNPIRQDVRRRRVCPWERCPVLRCDGDVLDAECEGPRLAAGPAGDAAALVAGHIPNGHRVAVTSSSLR
eukprot:4888998-Prymnesium_polylepis.1